MTDLLNKKPLIKQGWLRVLLFSVVYFIVSIFICKAIFLIIK
jgi:hypothetical protein